MPAVAKPVGRHRKRRLSRINVGIGLSLLALAVTAVAVSPSLLGWPVASPAAQTEPSAVAGLTPAPTGSVEAAVAPTSIVTGPTAAPATSTADAPPPPSPLGSFEATVVRLVNEARIEEGCSAVREDASLHAAARAHSMDMARYGYHSHTGRDGSDPGERMLRAGYDVDGGWAENIARGYPTPAAVMAGWMGKPKDTIENILKRCKLRAIGVGSARASSGEIYWTQDFGGR
jgi:uncharacterized protein YkwD